jgi:hypothetical protein
MVTETIERLVIPSAMAISLGIEIGLFSLLLSTFALNEQPYAVLAPETARSKARTIVLASGS